MRQRGWNYAAFAQTVGADGKAVAGWIRDSTPTPAMTRQIAQRLGVDEDDLMHLVGHREVEPSDATGTGAVTPEQADLIAKVTQVRLTPDGYRSLNLVFEHLRKRQSSGTG
jgi:hypothetical protein